MRVRDRGFALILVLVATATVFALAIQSGVIVRATTLEVAVLRERDAAQRGAHGAASLLVKSLLQGGSSVSDADIAASGNADAAPPDEEDIELPPLVKALLGDALKDLEDQAKDELEQDRQSLDLAAQGGGVSGRTSSVGSYRLLTHVISRSEPIIVRLPGDDLEYRITLADAGGQLSINSVTERQFDAYLEAVGLDALLRRRITDQLLDWRDADSVSRRYGMERSRYTALGIEPRNAPLRSIEELLYLPAMTRELFERIAPDCSVAGDNRIHAASASREVLLSVPGVSVPIAERILALRAAGALTPETLEKTLPVTADEAKKMLRAEPGNVLRITVEAVGDARHHFEGISVINENRIAALGLRPV